MTRRKVIIPQDYNDYLYRLTYYLISYIIPFVPKGISPNQITCMAFLSAMIGNVLLLTTHTRDAYLYWAIFNFLWFILDAMDGMHARYSNQTSEYGAFLDHSLDVIYFLFMLTAFAIKFNLSSFLYIYIIILRNTIATLVFITQCHTKRLYLPKFSGGLEFMLFTAAMLFSYAYPHLNFATMTENPTLLKWIALLDLQQGVFMKLALIPYFFAVPVTIVQQFLFTKKVLSVTV